MDSAAEAVRIESAIAAREAVLLIDQAALAAVPADTTAEALDQVRIEDHPVWEAHAAVEVAVCHAAVVEAACLAEAAEAAADDVNGGE